MNSKKVRFSNRQQALIAFPDSPTELPQALAALEIPFPGPVMFLSGGFFERGYERVTRQTIRMIARAASENQAILISGGTDMGVMAAMGQERARGQWDFPLLGITVKRRVTWPGGPRKRWAFWQKKQRGPLEPHHPYFILVPGEQFGNETPWIMQTITILAAENPAVTILVNGGKIARSEVNLSLETGRPVIVAAGTGRLADALAGEPAPSDLLKIVPAANKDALFNTIRGCLTPNASGPKS